MIAVTSCGGIYRHHSNVRSLENKPSIHKTLFKPICDYGIRLRRSADLVPNVSFNPKPLGKSQKAPYYDVTHPTPSRHVRIVLVIVRRIKTHYKKVDPPPVRSQKYIPRPEISRLIPHVPWDVQYSFFLQKINVFYLIESNKILRAR